jgi:hypothetical protein
VRNISGLSGHLIGQRKQTLTSAEAIEISAVRWPIFRRALFSSCRKKTFSAVFFSASYGCS